MRVVRIWLRGQDHRSDEPVEVVVPSSAPMTVAELQSALARRVPVPNPSFEYHRAEGHRNLIGPSFLGRLLSDTSVSGPENWNIVADVFGQPGEPCMALRLIMKSGPCNYSFHNCLNHAVVSPPGVQAGGPQAGGAGATLFGG
jgi:hypothetical protein